MGNVIPFRHPKCPISMITREQWEVLGVIDRYYGDLWVRVRSHLRKYAAGRAPVLRWRKNRIMASEIILQDGTVQLLADFVRAEDPSATILYLVWPDAENDPGCVVCDDQLRLGSMSKTGIKWPPVEAD